MFTNNKAVLTLILFICAIGTASADTIYVPDDYPTIQSAIDSSASGDIIIVRSGSYVENVDFLGKAIHVKSESGPGVTLIDGNQLGSVVSFQSGEGIDSVLDGFTVTNGTGTGSSVQGGGVFCWYSSPTLTGNVITKNQADLGGGIGCEENSSPVIVSNTITENSAVQGGGVWCDWDSVADISSNVITDNSADYGAGIYGNMTYLYINRNFIDKNTALYQGGGIYCTALTGANISDNIISSNSADKGGGVYFNDCWSFWYPSVSNNRIVGNSASSDGGGVYFKDFGPDCPPLLNETIAYNTAAVNGGGIYCEEVDSLTISNVILWNNSAQTGQELYFHSSWSLSNVAIRYSDVKGGMASIYVEPGGALQWGPGMIDTDPLFVDPTSNDFHLTWNSPCRDSGDNLVVTETNDFEGDPRIALGTVDMGADEYWYHLYHLGNVIPGESVSVRVIGWPNGCTKLLMGSGVMNPPQPTVWGDFYLESPISVFSLGLVPTNGVLIKDAIVPLWWSQGESYPFQAFIGSVHWPSSKLTNPMTLTVR